MVHYDWVNFTINVRYIGNRSSTLSDTFSVAITFILVIAFTVLVYMNKYYYICI